MMKRRKHKTSICPSFGRDETVTSDSLSPHQSLDIVMEAPANQPRRHVHSAWLSSRSMVRYAQLLHLHPLQDEHLFYHDGLPSYGNGDNCLWQGKCLNISSHLFLHFLSDPWHVLTATIVLDHFPIAARRFRVPRCKTSSSRPARSQIGK